MLIKMYMFKTRLMRLEVRKEDSLGTWMLDSGKGFLYIFAVT